MSFDTKVDQARVLRNPSALDEKFLAYNRAADRIRVDASGSTSRVVSASGTNSIPVYIDQPIPIAVDVDIETDEIKVYGASGVPSIETWINSDVRVVGGNPFSAVQLQRRFFYNANNDLDTIRVAPIATASGSPCLVLEFAYNSNNDLSYVNERTGTW